MNSITFKQYRNIDLTIFAALLILSEAITTVATNTWFAAQPIAISTTLVFICIVMMRWGVYAVIPACIGGAVFCIASGASAEQYLVYTVGNSAVMINLIWFKLFNKEEIRKSYFKLFLFVLTAYLEIVLARWLISLPFGGRLDTLLVYLGTDVISLLFAVVIMMLMRNTDGMIEDQKSYLLRLDRERNGIKEDRGGYGAEE